MLGFNGGLIGSRRQTSVVAAPGVWFPSEQCLANAEGKWPPFLVSAFSPVLWYDFSDEASVTVESSQITTIVDKGSASRDLVKSSTGPAYSIGINGLKCVDWGSSPHPNYLRNTSATSFTLAELYIVQDSAFGGSAPNFNGLVGNANNETVRFYGFGDNATVTGYSAAFLGTSTTAANPSIASLDSPSLVRLRLAAPTSMTAGFLLGNETINFALNRGWYGFIGEVVGFSSYLDDATRSGLNNYLSSKWGLGIV